jgi:hypothetical protein
MDIKCNAAIVQQILPLVISVAVVVDLVQQYAVEYSFTENGVCHCIDTKMYLRILAFQIAVYVEQGMHSTKRIPRRRRHPIRFTKPEIVVKDTGYFTNYSEAMMMFQEHDSVSCCCAIMPGLPLGTKEDGSSCSLSVPSFKAGLNFTVIPRFHYELEPRVQIYYRNYPASNLYYDNDDYHVWAFIESDPDFLVQLYP